MRWHIALALLLAGCGGPRTNVEAPVVQTQLVQSHDSSIRLNETKLAANYTINAEPSKVWAFVPDVYSDLGIVAAVLDSRNRVFGNTSLTNARVAGEPISSYVRCSAQGTGPGSVNMMRYQLSVATSVVSKNGVTSVETELMGLGRSVDGSSRAATPCVSTGILEKKIADALKDRIKQSS